MYIITFEQEWVKGFFWEGKSLPKMNLEGKPVSTTNQTKHLIRLPLGCYLPQKSHLREGFKKKKLMD